MPIARPVYLVQLVVLQHTDKNINEGEAECVDVALTCAEGLIRQKKGFGLEPSASAIELIHAMVLMAVIGHPATVCRRHAPPVHALLAHAASLLSHVVKYIIPLAVYAAVVSLFITTLSTTEAL